MSTTTKRGRPPMQVDTKEPYKQEIKTTGTNASQSDPSHSISTSCSSTLLYTTALLVRISSVFLVQTSYVPDEYWQSIEVAHRMSFGYGYLTWEWQEGIRGFTHPFIFTIFYKMLSMLQLDLPEILVTGPRIIQAVFTSVADVCLFRLTEQMFCSNSAYYAFLLQISSWFLFYVGSRTLTNTMEMILTISALSYWPWPFIENSHSQSQTSLQKAFLLCGVSCLIRPTAIITFVPLVLWQLQVHRNSGKYLGFIVTGMSAAVFLLFLSIGIDYLFYKKIIIVQLNFFRFNILRNIGAFYGSHSWHWYITQGIPVMVFTHLIPFFIGVFHEYNSKRSHGILLWMIVLQIFVYSCLAHKEFRFPLPILPLFICYAGYGLNITINPHLDKSNKAPESLQSTEYRKKLLLRKEKGLLILVFVVISNVIAALYTGVVHQRGVLDVMPFLRSEIDKSDGKASVLFLMPCHSTPFYSHIHRNVPMRFLKCDPSNEVGYVEEAEVFYKDPEAWLQLEYQTKSSEGLQEDIPTHIVLFDKLEKEVLSYLQRNNYKKCGSFFHSHFPDGRVGGYVFVWCKKSTVT